MNKQHEERDRLAVRCFNNLPPEIAEPRIIGFRFGFDAATEIHQKRIERLREALEGLLYYWTNTPCRFDHNGNCRAHSCFGYDKTCSVADARAALQEETK